MNVCKGCGKEIMWGVTPNGKKIPLDKKAPVYAVMAGQGEEPGLIQITRDDNSFVSHFATCSKANDFSNSKKEIFNENRF